MKIEKEVLFKLKRIAPVKRNKSAEKQTRAKKRFTLPAKLSEFIWWEDTQM